ncbi:MscL family protein [Carnobacterium funditum]|uniref:MscL family protein n=1 Tax=Carnobacterium funditum TaxID=2752 RepID=UPI000A83F7A6|nr:MscL family protein [Carnobacterium funditum]
MILIKNFLTEFKEFAFRGNVLDLAAGIVNGAAFTTIITSLVENISILVVGILTGGHDISALSVTIGSAKLAYGFFYKLLLTF